MRHRKPDSTLGRSFNFSPGEADNTLGRGIAAMSRAVRNELCILAIIVTVLVLGLIIFRG